MRVGIVYDLFDDYPRREADPIDIDAENEPPETIEAIEDALIALGHKPVRLGSPLRLASRLEATNIDVAVNIAEGARSRNREAFAPILLELAGIPYIGSDALTLSISLDKACTKDLVVAAGVRTPPWSVLSAAGRVPSSGGGESSPTDTLLKPAQFPLFIKPRYQGSAMGIQLTSRVENELDYRTEVERQMSLYGEDLLIEQFIEGSEYTVAVLGNDPPEALPVLQRAVEVETGIGLHALDRKGVEHRDHEWHLPSSLTPELEQRLKADAVTIYEKLECLDFARVDFRVSRDGTIFFLEINPLPTFAPDGTFAVLAEIVGTTYPEFLARVLKRALDRSVAKGPVLEKESSDSHGVPTEQGWSDWRWQMRNRIRTLDRLEEVIRTTPGEREAIEKTAGVFNWSITPYYASLMDPEDPSCPIRRQVVPSLDEIEMGGADETGGVDETGRVGEWGIRDPLEEVAHSPVKNLIHNYEDRVAFCVTSECAIYCRYCLRKRMVGDASFMMRKPELQEAIDYIRAHPEIRDVLLTGGDPLTLGERALDWLLSRLRSIDHVDIIRIGTRMPVKLPFRITETLTEVLSRYHPLWINTHFNHPKEVTLEAGEAINKLLRAGIPVGNQTVLLKGINDDLESMRELLKRLVGVRVRPYYLYQAQVIGGTSHFRTSIEVGMDLMERLQGHITGFALPQYVLDTPFGKIPLNRSYVIGRAGEHVLMRSTRGTLWAEPNPAPAGLLKSYLPAVDLPVDVATIDNLPVTSCTSGL